MAVAPKADLYARAVSDRDEVAGSILTTWKWAS